jgi:hypothetical protein
MRRRSKVIGKALLSNKASDRLKMGNLLPSSSKPLHQMKWNLNQEVLGWFIPFQAYVLWAEPTFQHDYCQEMMCVHLWRATTGSTEPIFLTWKSICDKVCQWHATDRWFSLGTPASSTNKTDRHDITEILLKVVLNTITPGNENLAYYCIFKESHWKQDLRIILSAIVINFAVHIDFHFRKILT